MDTGTIRTIVGIIGNVISFCLFISPTPTFVYIVKQKSVQEYKPDPYLATFLNCLLWIFYGLPLVHPHSMLIVTINCAGCLIELIFCVIFFIFSPWSGRKKIILIMLIEVLFVAVFVVVTLVVFHTTEKRSMVVGILCVILNIVMYASPLTVMKRVIQTKSVKYMPFSLSFVSLVNGMVWVGYAALKFDLYILIPNCAGVLSAIVQLFLYATYYKTTNWDETSTREEVEMPAASSNA